MLSIYSRQFLALSLLACFASASIAEEKTYTLRYKFETGDVIRYEVDHRANIKSTMEKTTKTARTRTESVKAWKVIDVLPTKLCPEGEIEFHNVVERVKMTNRLPDRAEMKFDSENDKDPPAGFVDAARAVGVPLSAVRMTPWGKVISREVKHEQPAADPTAPITVLLPEDAVAVGDSWDEPQAMQATLPEGGTKAIKTRRRLTLKSVEDGVAIIEATQQVLTPVSASIEAQLAQRMLEGEIRFDIAAGRILSQEMEVDRRIVGFAGPNSRMHYVMRMTEQLVEKTAFRERSVLKRK